MKILTKEEEQEHYKATLTGGLLGGTGGLAFGVAGVYAAAVRYPAFRQLTLPLRAFLVTSSTTFGAIVAADSYSRHYEKQRNPEANYQDEQASIQAQANAQKSTGKRVFDFIGENRYSFVFGTWVVGMGTALGLVGRNPYLTGQQKLVQARVYAQGFTVAAVILSLAFEGNDQQKGRGRWETVKILDPNDPTHQHVIEKKIHHEAYAGEDQWRDMIEQEERRIKEQGGHRYSRHDKEEKRKAKEQAEQSESSKQGQSNQKQGQSNDKHPEQATSKGQDGPSEGGSKSKKDQPGQAQQVQDKGKKEKDEKEAKGQQEKTPQSDNEKTQQERDRAKEKGTAHHGQTGVGAGEVEKQKGKAKA